MACTWRFAAIGTHWEIETDQPLDPSLRAAVTDRIDRFDAIWSRFRTDSVVQRLRRGGTIPLSPSDAGDTAAMLALYRDLSRATGGAVTPLAGGGLEALGYDRALSLRAGDPRPAPGGWERMLRSDATALALEAPAADAPDLVIDVGAIGKGLLVDLVSEVLRAVPGRVTVDGSGDMRIRGGTSRVALEHPYDPTAAIGVVEVTDAALCASAITRRAWGDGLHHVIDGRTGLPVRTWAATWALAGDAMRADAIATALFFDDGEGLGGGPALAGAWGVEWVRMTTAGRVERSAGFPGELFTAPPHRG